MWLRFGDFFISDHVFCTDKLCFSSCDRRRLGSDDRNGVAKRSWLISVKAAFLGVSLTLGLELLGVHCTKKKMGKETKKNSRMPGKMIKN